MIDKWADKKILVTLAFADIFPHFFWCFRSQLLLLIVGIWEPEVRTELALVVTSPELLSSLGSNISPKNQGSLSQAKKGSKVGRLRKPHLLPPLLILPLPQACLSGTFQGTVGVPGLKVPSIASHSTNFQFGGVKKKYL